MSKALLQSQVLNNVFERRVKQTDKSRSEVQQNSEAGRSRLEIVACLDSILLKKEQKKGAALQT